MFVTQACHVGAHENHDRHRPLYPQTNGVVRTLAQTSEWLRRSGTKSYADAAGLPQHCVPNLSGNSPVAIAAQARGKEHRRLLPAGAAHCDRRAARSRGEAPLPAAPIEVTTSYHTSSRSICARASPSPSPSPMGVAPVSTVARCVAWSARNRCGTSCRRAASRIWPPGGAAWIRISSNLEQGLLEPAPPDCSLRRPCRGGEEHRGVPPHAVGWQQTGDRRRPGTRAAAKLVSGDDVHGVSICRGSCAHLAAADVHGLSKPHGYVSDW